MNAVTYCNNFSGLTTTEYYDVNCVMTNFIILKTTNDGTLVSVGSMDLHTKASNGFNIVSTTNNEDSIFTACDVTLIHWVNFTVGMRKKFTKLSQLNKRVYN